MFQHFKMFKRCLINFFRLCATESNKTLWTTQTSLMGSCSLKYTPLAICSDGLSQFISQNRTFSTKRLNKASRILSKLLPQSASTDNNEADREEKRKKEKANENGRTWKRIKLGLLGCSAFALSVWGIYEFGKPDFDTDGNVIEDEFTKDPIVQQYVKRMWKLVNYYQKLIQKHLQKKVLPDPLKLPYIQPPYTLVLEMKDVLVHPDWSYQTGWRFKKRPGVDYFLQECTKHFEIVVFTTDEGVTVFPILDALDPKGYIKYRLVRDATHFIDGQYVKNLDILNRDLRNVIVIDWDANSTKLHPENTFNLKRWLGNDDDVSLFDLINFLNTLAEAEVEDVREVLSYYRQYEDPLRQFRENQRKLLEQMEEHELEEKAKAKPIVKKGKPNFMSRS